jgi:hypothetical protein
VSTGIPFVRLGDDRAGDDHPGDDHAGDDRAGDDHPGDDHAGDHRVGPASGMRPATYGRMRQTDVPL